MRLGSSRTHPDLELVGLLARRLCLRMLDAVRGWGFRHGVAASLQVRITGLVRASAPAVSLAASSKPQLVSTVSYLAPSSTQAMFNGGSETQVWTSREGQRHGYMILTAPDRCHRKWHVTSPLSCLAFSRSQRSPCWLHIQTPFGSKTY